VIALHGVFCGVYDEAVAPAGHVRSILSTGVTLLKSLPKRRDVDAEADLFRSSLWPNALPS
jgi:hypothetical protein